MNSAVRMGLASTSGANVMDIRIVATVRMKPTAVSIARSPSGHVFVSFVRLLYVAYRYLLDVRRNLENL